MPGEIEGRQLSMLWVTDTLTKAAITTSNYNQLLFIAKKA
jgi:hypothetical protein